MSHMDIPVEPDPALLRARPRRVYVELTSRCNVRCVYCPVSQADYVGQDLEMDAEAVADLLERFHPGEVRISGHGETTMLPDWTETARVFLDRGFPVTLTTNMAKRMSDEEIDVLSRMRSLEISVDSSDPELQFQLRRGVKLERVEETMERIHELCEREYREPPYLNLSCTVTDVCVPGLPDLVRWAARQRAHAVGLVNMERYPDPPGAIPVLHPSESNAEETRDRIAEARALARETGLHFTVEPGLSDALQEVLG